MSVYSEIRPELDQLTADEVFAALLEHLHETTPAVSNLNVPEKPDSKGEAEDFMRFVTVDWYGGEYVSSGTVQDAGVAAKTNGSVTQEAGGKWKLDFGTSGIQGADQILYTSKANAKADLVAKKLLLTVADKDGLNLSVEESPDIQPFETVPENSAPVEDKFDAFIAHLQIAAPKPFDATLPERPTSEHEVLEILKYVSTEWFGGKIAANGDVLSAKLAAENHANIFKAPSGAWQLEMTGKGIQGFDRVFHDTWTSAKADADARKMILEYAAEANLHFGLGETFETLSSDEVSLHYVVGKGSKGGVRIELEGEFAGTAEENQPTGGNSANETMMVVASTDDVQDFAAMLVEKMGGKIVEGNTFFGTHQFGQVLEHDGNAMIHGFNSQGSLKVDFSDAAKATLPPNPSEDALLEREKEISQKFINLMLSSNDVFDEVGVFG